MDDRQFQSTTQLPHRNTQTASPPHTIRSSPTPQPRVARSPVKVSRPERHQRRPNHESRKGPSFPSLHRPVPPQYPHSCHRHQQKREVRHHIREVGNAQPRPLLGELIIRRILGHRRNTHALRGSTSRSAHLPHESIALRPCPSQALYGQCTVPDHRMPAPRREPSVQPQTRVTFHASNLAHPLAYHFQNRYDKV